jgi:hypothetical protein
LPCLQLGRNAHKSHHDLWLPLVGPGGGLVHEATGQVLLFLTELALAVLIFLAELDLTIM